MNRVEILLSTYNGEKYLREQLNSLLWQTYKKFRVVIRDDGSSDETLNILQEYEENYPDKILLMKDNIGNLGSCKSFIKLLNNAKSDYIMLCDQDDLWNKNKIEITLIKMQQMETKFNNIPLLVHSDLEVVDEQLNSINSSFMNFQNINPSKNKFHYLLMQNIITGCTIMINRKLAQKHMPENVMHDWWIGLVASKFGKIGYISESTIKYRQHSNNVIGAKGFTINELFRKIYLLTSSNIVQQYQRQATIFLEQFKNELDNETIKMLQDFSTIEQKNWLQKIIILWKHKLFKQGFIRNVGLFLKI